MKQQLKHKLMEEKHKNDKYFTKIDHNCFAYADDELEIKTVVVNGKDVITGNGISWWNGIFKNSDDSSLYVSSNRISDFRLGYSYDENYSVQEFIDMEDSGNDSFRIVFISSSGRITRITEPYPRTECT